jgi:hypothetical protein
MNNRVLLYPVNEARRILCLSNGKLASVVVGCRRFVSHEAIVDFIAKSTTTQSPTEAPTRLRKADQNELPLPLPPVPRRQRQSGNE